MKNIKELSVVLLTCLAVVVAAQVNAEEAQDEGALILIWKGSELVDFDPDARGGDFDPGEAYRYDLASGAKVYLGNPTSIRVIMAGGEEESYADEPAIESRSQGGHTAATYGVAENEVKVVIIKED